MIYLDHAATTPVLEEVAHAVYDTLVSGWAVPHWKAGAQRCRRGARDDCRRARLQE